jgi:hypothetical protein
MSKRRLFFGSRENSAESVLKTLFKLLILPSLIISGIVLIRFFCIGRYISVKDLMPIFGAAIFVDCIIIFFIQSVSEMFASFAEENGNIFILIGLVRFVVILIQFILKSMYLLAVMDFILLVASFFIVNFISSKLDDNYVPRVLFIFYYIIGLLCFFEIAGIFHMAFLILG